MTAGVSAGAATHPLDGSTQLKPLPFCTTFKLCVRRSVSHDSKVYLPRLWLCVSTASYSQPVVPREPRKPTSARLKSTDCELSSLPNPMKARTPTGCPPLVAEDDRKFPGKTSPAGMSGLPLL